MPYNYDTLVGECPDKAHTAKFFQNCGLLHAERFYHCGSQMRPSSMTTRHGNKLPAWRCPINNCKATKGLRPDTWFFASQLPFHTILKFIYWWSTEQTSIEFFHRELDMNHSTTVDW